MFLRKVRRIGRLFAVVLLAWTAIDLLDRHACQNHPALPVVASSTGEAALGPPADAGGDDRHDAGFPPGHSGDCFCCSAFVDVRLPFSLTVASEYVWVEPTAVHGYSSVSLHHIFRPPITERG
ncbi:MAG: hypothetical protein EHM13_02160 [Acidobacteria bacterium]|nr:MAG: hypothetical protein EHM13_02160 [Acidobacteriota bacterium]